MHTSTEESQCWQPLGHPEKVIHACKFEPIKQINGNEDPIRLTKKFYDKAISKYPQEFFQILKNTVHELEEGHKKYSEFVCDYYALELRTRAYRDKTRRLKKDIARPQKGIAVKAAYANALKKQIADNQVVIQFLNGQFRQSPVLIPAFLAICS